MSKDKKFGTSRQWLWASLRGVTHGVWDKRRGWALYPWLGFWGGLICLGEMRTAVVQR